MLRSPPQETRRSSTSTASPGIQKGRPCTRSNTRRWQRSTAALPGPQRQRQCSCLAALPRGTGIEAVSLQQPLADPCARVPDAHCLCPSRPTSAVYPVSLSPLTTSWFGPSAGVHRRPVVVFHIPTPLRAQAPVRNCKRTKATAALLTGPRRGTLKPDAAVTGARYKVVVIQNSEWHHFLAGMSS